MIDNPAAVCVPSNMVGYGANREVFRAPGTDWVVKADIPGDEIEHIGSNAYEWETYEYLRDNVELPYGVKLPEMHFVDGYIIAQFIKGRHPDNYDYDWYSLVRMARLYDMHSKNVIIDSEGTIWIVDLGGGSFDH